MGDTHERRNHFRGNPRPGRRIEIQYCRKGSGDDLITAVTRNIGVGGAFILCDERPAIGELLELHLQVPSSEDTIEVDAEVRWENTGEDEDSTSGVGVKFLGLDVDALLSLSEYFASLTGQDS